MDDKHEHVRKRLFEKYSPTTSGTWRIFGEDPNCDWGGSHHEPELEVVTGTYRNVVEYALTLPGFFAWGSGGRIALIPGDVKNIDKVMTNPRIKVLKTERDKLQGQLDKINEELTELEKGK